MEAGTTVRRLIAGTALAALAGCGDVQVGAESSMPTPLIDPLPVTVGVNYSDDFKKYAHAEERWGVDWKVDLGPYHVRMADHLFGAEFKEVVPVDDLAHLPVSPPYSAIVQPLIEQYSFITPRDTGAKYFAVTIKYRLNVFSPKGELADSLTFTGYGSAKAGGMTSTAPMIVATKAAMRDAAAKFLTQFPQQDVVRRLVAGQPLVAPPSNTMPAADASGVVATAAAGSTAAAASSSTAVDDVVIDTVPIIDPDAGTTTGAASPPAASTPPPGAPPANEPGNKGTDATTTESQPAPGGDSKPPEQPATPAPDSASKPQEQSSTPAPDASPPATPPPPP